MVFRPTLTLTHSLSAIKQGQLAGITYKATFNPFTPEADNSAKVNLGHITPFS